jgi:repressor LexA
MPDVKVVSAAGSKSPVTPPMAANDQVIELPLHGRIAAGMPIEAIEGQSSLPVPAALLGPGEHYALEVAGDSMVEEGILDGDYALIRKRRRRGTARSWWR